MQGRNKQGKFTSKSNSDRVVRSIRATDATWSNFGEQAATQSITRADLLEEMFSNDNKDGVLLGEKELKDDRVLHDALEVLKKAIAPKKDGGSYVANNAKGLKEEVLKAIALLED